MTDDITIPPKALAAMRAKLPPFFSESMARAACLAMLKAWPRMEIERFAPWSKDRTIHLPLPKETDNAEG
jgi:hypothetical protein